MSIILIGIGIILVFFISANWGSGQSNCPCPAPSTDWIPCLCPSNIVMKLEGKYTAQQIAVFASNAGFAGNDLAVAVAIALAESNGGDPNAYNPVKVSDSGRPLDTPDGQGAIGLWQIYLYVHPEFATFNLYDPQQNAQAAFNLYQRRGFRFSDWTTFINGKYQRFLPVSQQAASMIFNQGGALANV